jgi:hypothetical protein
MDDKEILVPWSEDPEENLRNINACARQAKEEGKQLRSDARPYRLSARDISASKEPELPSRNEHIETPLLAD